MGGKFPFKTVRRKDRLKDLLTVDFYKFLSNFFSSVVIDPTLAPDANGAYKIVITSDGKECRWPIGAGSASYASYFRVIDASTADPAACKIGVTSGGNTVSGICGTVKINGERVDVAATVTNVSTTAGEYHVWLHMWISAEDGEQAEIIVGPADDDTPPDNPNGGLIYGSQLIGRVVVTGVDPKFITSLTQDYLRGGEHSEILWGDCTGESIGAPAP